MAALRGRDEVRRRRRRLQSAIELIDDTALHPELVSHYSRYLAVLVSGYVEQSVKELARDYSRMHSNPSIQRFVGKHVESYRNIDAEKLKKLTDSIEPAWWAAVEGENPDEMAALKSIASIRNSISHGSDSGITMTTVKNYLNSIDSVMERLIDLFQGTSST